MQTPGPDSPGHDSPGPQRVVRPWGWFETLGEGPGYRVKRLLLLPGLRLSLQRHRHRCEHWVVVEGSGRLQLEQQATRLRRSYDPPLCLGIT